MWFTLYIIFFFLLRTGWGNHRAGCTQCFLCVRRGQKHQHCSQTGMKNVKYFNFLVIWIFIFFFNFFLFVWIFEHYLPYRDVHSFSLPSDPLPSKPLRNRSINWLLGELRLLFAGVNLRVNLLRVEHPMQGKWDRCRCPPRCHHHLLKRVITILGWLVLLLV